MAAKSKFVLYLSQRSPLKRNSVHETFREACLLGQQLAGYACFHVDSGDYVPSRSEQLLEEGAEPIRRIKKLLALTEAD